MRKSILAALLFLALPLHAQTQSAPGQPPPTTPPPDFVNGVDTVLGFVPQGWYWNVTSKLSIGVSTDIGDFYTVGARDYYNGQWLSGWGKELFPITYNGNEAAYLSAQNVFNANEGGKGAIGGAFGIRPINLINAIGTAAGAASNVIKLPPWAQSINNFMSVEAGADYRIQNTPGVSRLVLTVGGQVRVPFDLLKGL